MKNIEEIRDMILNAMKELKAGTMTHQIAKEINNGGGKVSQTFKVQLEYYALRKESPKTSQLTFLN